MSLTTDPNDPRLTHGVDAPDAPPKPKAEVYLVLSEEDRALGFIRPVRRSYWHQKCGAITTMGKALSETYARNPSFYGATFCVGCGLHRPVGAAGEFYWCNPDADPETLGQGPKVGT